MAQPYVGEIRMFAGNYAPAGWEFCEGQTLAVDENETLFQLIGTTYGGDGNSTFGLPDLRGRLPIHMGNGYELAQIGGAEEVTLSSQQLPAHSHVLGANGSVGTTSSPTGNLLAASPSVRLYRETTPGVSLAPNAMGSTGGNQPHSNVQPYLCVNFIISLFGIFPSPS